ncbi:MAG: CBS domain-containing protein, partial [Alphaproteobacteria bacterium]
DGDLRRLMAGKTDGHTVDDVMSTNPRTIGADTLAAAALEVLNSASITALIVAEDGRPVGLVHLHDLLRLGAA